MLMTHSNTSNNGNPLVVSLMPKRSEFISELNNLFFEGLQESNPSSEWVIVDETKIYSAENSINPLYASFFYLRRIKENLLYEKMIDTDTLVFVMPFCLPNINFSFSYTLSNTIPKASFESIGENCLITGVAFPRELLTVFDNQSLSEDISMGKIVKKFPSLFAEHDGKKCHYILIFSKENEYDEISLNFFKDKQNARSNSNAAIKRSIYEKGQKFRCCNMNPR